MRTAIVAALLLAPLPAAAGPVPPTATLGAFHDAIAQPAKRGTPGTKAFTNVSHVIYLNPCLPDGCTVAPGRDDSRTDHSSIPESQAHLAAYPWGADSWNGLVQCVKDMYGPFDVTVTDVDPGTAAHFEVMIAGNANDVGVPGAGGVAPFIPCDGQLEDNVISYVFATQTSDLAYLCWAAAQESSHVFGLDHELDAKDPMTYLSPPVKKPGFQNDAANCGEDTPRDCWCGGKTQNSYQYLMDTFGPAQLDPATLAIDAPADGAWVKPGFTVRATATSQLSVRGGSLLLDGVSAETVGAGKPLVFKAPATMAGGDHTIGVDATDAADRTFTNQVTVHVTDRCDDASPCGSSFHCLGGYCLPGRDVAGGLGADCTDSSACITGSCGSLGTVSLCTGACDAGDTCPSGFECVSATNGTSTCWPGTGSSGGCATSNGGSPLLALFGLGALVMIARRRR